MFRHPAPFQMLGNLLDALLAASVPQLSQHSRVSFALHNRAQNRHPRDSGQIRHGMVDFDIHRVQSLLHPLDDASHLLFEVTALPNDRA